MLNKPLKFLLPRITYDQYPLKLHEYKQTKTDNRAIEIIG